MKNLKTVIEQVKSSRLGENRAWIYDENGNIKEDVYVFDILPFLSRLLDYEIAIEESDVKDSWDNYITADNTYNHGCNVSNDLDFRVVKDDDGDYIAFIKVHLFGDIRGGYSADFAINLGEYKTLIEFLYYEIDEDCRQSKELDSRYTVDMDIFSEGVSVWDSIAGEDYEVCEIEKDDILKKIEEIKEEN